MTIIQALRNALDFIEAKHGHRSGDIYQDAEKAIVLLESGAFLEHELPEESE